VLQYKNETAYQRYSIRIRT